MPSGPTARLAPMSFGGHELEDRPSPASAMNAHARRVVVIVCPGCADPRGGPFRAAVCDGCSSSSVIHPRGIERGETPAHRLVAFGIANDATAGAGRREEGSPAGAATTPRQRPPAWLIGAEIAAALVLYLTTRATGQRARDTARCRKRAGAGPPVRPAPRGMVIPRVRRRLILLFSVSASRAVAVGTRWRPRR
jgi:hypothetical protein